MTTLQEGLVVRARSMPGNPYDGHILGEALEQAEILSEVKPEMALVDRGDRSVDIDHVRVWKSGQRRGVTRGVWLVTPRSSRLALHTPKSIRIIRIPTRKPLWKNLWVESTELHDMFK